VAINCHKTCIDALDGIMPCLHVCMQFWLVMHYLSRMTDEQTLVLYSGHPLGLFPSNRHAPRAVITNGIVRLSVCLCLSPSVFVCLSVSLSVQCPYASPTIFFRGPLPCHVLLLF